MSPAAIPKFSRYCFFFLKTPNRSIKSARLNHEQQKRTGRWWLSGVSMVNSEFQARGDVVMTVKVTAVRKKKDPPSQKRQHKKQESICSEI
jgi:hypothetical protein